MTRRWVAESGAIFDGAGVAEQVAQDVVKFRKERSAVIFHCEVQDLMDIEEFTEEMQRKPKWRFNRKEKEGHCGSEVVSTNALGKHVREACAARFLECGVA